MASISKTTFTWVYEMGRLEQETEEGRGTVMLSRQAINILLRAYRERGMWARKGEWFRELVCGEVQSLL